MSKKKSETLRSLWPRVTRFVAREKLIVCVDGRPTAKRRYFKHPEEALAHAQELAEFRKHQIEEPLQFSSRLRVIAADGEKALRDKGASLREAIAFYLDHLEQAVKKEPEMTMAQAFEQYMASRLREYKSGQIGKVTYEGTIHRLKRDQEYFNVTLVSNVSPKDILAYIESGKMSSTTKRNNKVRLSHFFNFCRLHGWIDANPCSLITVRVSKRDIQIFTIEETIDLLRECYYSDCAHILVPFAAVCFFAGLRPKEAERLRWEFIDFKTRHIEITSATRSCLKTSE